MENRVPFQINGLAGFVPVFAALGRIGHVRLLRCGGAVRRNIEGTRARLRETDHLADAVKRIASRPLAVVGEGELAMGDGDTARGFAGGGELVGVKIFDGAPRQRGQEEVLGEAQQIAGAFGNGPLLPAVGGRQAIHGLCKGVAGLFVCMDDGCAGHGARLAGLDAAIKEGGCGRGIGLAVAVHLRCPESCDRAGARACPVGGVRQG